jgi:hypothetical protein
MKRLVIEGAIVGALVLALDACERDAMSGGRSGPSDKPRDVSAQTSQGNDGGWRDYAPASPQQMTGGSGGTITGGSGGTYGTGGSGGSSTGGTGGTFSSSGSGGIGGTGTGGSGAIGGMSTGGTGGASGSY